tara:strand:+ start:194 stop:535 length:342 start_codon:yes stop_codon:yes gene_type:complete
MTFEDSIIYINSKGFSAYEIHQKTGLNEAGVRKVLNNKVANPQRKTKEIIIAFATKAIESDKNNVTLSVDELKRMEDLASNVIKNHKKLLQTEMYSLWFEVECQKRVIEILKE